MWSAGSTAGDRMSGTTSIGAPVRPGEGSVPAPLLSGRSDRAPPTQLLPISATTATLPVMSEELTLTDAAMRFGANARTLRHAAAQGHLKARKIGTLWVTTPRHVEAWLARGKHTPGPATARKAPKRPSTPRRSIDAPPLGPEPRGPRGRTMTGYERSREG